MSVSPLFLGVSDLTLHLGQPDAKTARAIDVNFQNHRRTDIPTVDEGGGVRKVEDERPVTTRSVRTTGRRSHSTKEYSLLYRLLGSGKGNNRLFGCDRPRWDVVEKVRRELKKNRGLRRRTERTCHLKIRSATDNESEAQQLFPRV